METSVAHLNRQTRGSVERALQFEHQLTVLYAGQLRRAARLAANRFKASARPAPVAAAANPQPDWLPPDVDELTGDPLDAAAAKKQRRLHLEALIAAAPPAIRDAADDLGISFDTSSPFIAPLLDKVGARAANLTLSARDVVRKVVGQAYTAGWSVPQTAAALQQQIEELGGTTAVMQARTDLVGIGNGASLASVKVLGEQAPATKIWQTAEDDRVRPTHADADGQEVPLDQPFQVGDDDLAFPGDPDGSDAEVINCRCVVTYGDGHGHEENLEASAARATPADFAAWADYAWEGFAEPARGGVQPGENLPSTRMGTETVSPDALLAGATSFADYPLSDRDRAWDAGEAMQRWQTFCGIGGGDAQSKQPDWAKFHTGFFWYDSDDPEKVTSHKLPFVDVVDGKAVAVWRGVTAGAQRLSGAQIPAADKAKVRAHMGRYYAKAAKQYDDPAIETPWAALVAGVTINIGDDDQDDDAGMDGAAAAEVSWQAVLCVEGEQTEDGRLLAPNSITWRDTPLPLGVMFDTPHGWGDDSPVCGRIDRIWRDGNQIMGAGILNADENGCRAADLISNESLRGISVDLLVRQYRLEPASPPVVVDDVPDDGDGDEDPAEQIAEFENMLMVVTDGVIGGATVCPVQAIANATIQIVAAGIFVQVGAAEPEPEPEPEPVREAVVAAASRPAPPKEWFETQEPPGPMPLTVTDDGRVFGHLALWESCHTGFEGQCVRPPRSASGYAYFHVGEIDTAAGERVTVGKLMIAKPGRSGSHASLQASRLEAARHYDDNTAIGAYVRVVDGRYGPWAAGCVRPDLDDDSVRQLKANPPSGDWRKVNGSLELIAALSVPVPGFPVPRADVSLAASGATVEVAALVASSGLVEPTEFVLRALERAAVLPNHGRRLRRPQSKAV